MKRMNRPHLRWCDYDNNGDILPPGYKRLKDGTIVDTTEMKDDTPDDDIIRTPMFKVDPMGRVDRLW